ncbi:carbamoyltransferase family protein [Nitrospina watsonii]|uniref:Carbamoyltransferase n=1 Tax=Nitrospina watsonii TaxID=1323948 RepID=A0ABM9HBL3_9BACT|nr:carbamoyltransferase [Nitrospina watsonii]CAI2717625.1 Putative Carbamoyltransferase [Nitrospina watsonii]
MRVLGISAYYHDSAAALLQAGRVVAAAQEERFTRLRHDARFPEHAIRYCLHHAGIGLDAIDRIVFYEKPFLKFERLLETCLAFAPRGFQTFQKAIPVWIKEKLFQKKMLHHRLQALGWEGDPDRDLLFSEHHLSHAASAFYPSPFEEAAVLTLDGVGEWATASCGIGRGRELTLLKEIHFPHSLGLLYSAFTHYAGFRVNSGEYKLMGLAPYGEPRYKDAILENLIDVKDDGSFRLDLSYFNYCTGLTMTNERFHRLFGGPPRRPETEALSERHMDLAASIQAVTEEVVLRLARSLAKETGMKHLCLAGGVALNCVANGRVLREGGFERIWIQPAAGDAGGALGAAFCGYHLFERHPRTVSAGLDGMQGAYLGPEFSQEDIRTRLEALGAQFVVMDDSDLVEACAEALAAGQAVGWFQGRMEFGPRALGNRSILGDPRSPDMQSVLNLKVKNRESFRPFAPSVLREEVARYFEMDADSPYMLLVAEVAQRRRRSLSDADRQRTGFDKLKVARSDLPAVTHVDGSARIQTVHKETNPRYDALIRAFQRRTGCPVLVNTSFNVRGEPVVCTPEDAFRCFMGTEIDVLAMGNCYLKKAEQNPALKKNHAGAFELD